MTTQLEAVNMALRQIGQRKVSSTTVALNVVTDALAMISEVTTAVQSDEWGFNYEQNYPLVVATDGTISAPTGYITIEASNRGMEVLIRGGKLYDNKKHTFQFTHTLNCDIRWELAWDDLPPTAQYYIAVRAARAFAKLRLTDEKVGNLTQETESEALRLLLRADTGTNHPTALDAPDMWWVDQYTL